MKSTLVELVKVGLAGLIYLPEAADTRAADEAWLRSSFSETGKTRRTEWRSEDIFAISQEHVDEAGGQPGRRECAVPAAAGLQGVALVQGFPAAADNELIDRASLGMLQAVKASGLAGLEKLNGPWAGFFWDRSARKACFVRDGLGALTLFVGEVAGRIVFSTDLRIFLSSGLFEGLNEQSIVQFLHFLYVPTPATIIPGVRAVLPGYGLWAPGGSTQERFTFSLFTEGPRTLGPEETEAAIAREVPRFREHLLRAVSECVPPTGRIALALSGGKDSSAVAIALSEVCPNRVLAFTVGAENQRFNEVPDAALVCKALGLEFQPFVPSDQQLADGIEPFASVQDQPVGDLAAYPYFLAMKYLPDDCSVLFDGTGTDYYFGLPNPAKGVDIFGRRHALQQAIPSFLWPVMLRLMSLGPRQLRDLGQHWSRPIEESFLPWRGWSRAELEELSGHEVSFADTYLYKVMNARPASDWVGLMTDFLSHVMDPHGSYRKALHFAHALGKGVRFPFADMRIADYVRALPVELKFTGSRNKVLLRAFLATRLPAEILNKPKSGFIPELSRILGNPRYAWLDDLERSGRLRFAPGWQDGPIRKVRALHAADPSLASCQHRLYALALLASVIGVQQGWRPTRAQ